MRYCSTMANRAVPMEPPTLWTILIMVVARGTAWLVSDW
jgi:hypothetical protein